jgi:hypothetical protein
MERLPGPARPPKLDAPPRRLDASGTTGPLRRVLNRAAGRARETFDSLEVRFAGNRRKLAAARLLHRALRTVAKPLPRTPEAPELDQVRKLGPAAPLQANGENVLVMSFRGWTTHAAAELLIGHALRRRGARPTFVVCGGGLPRTELGRPRSEFPAPCATCRAYVTGMLEAAALPYVLVDDLVGETEREEISDLVARATDLETFEIEGIRPAEHVVRSTLWVARSGLATRDLHSRPEFREFVESAAIVARAFAQLLERDRPDAVVMVSGLFFAESVMKELAERRGIRVVSYDFPGRPGTVFVSDDIPASFYDVGHLWASRRLQGATPEQRSRIQQDMAARLEGSDLLWGGFDASAPPPPTPEGATRLAVFTNVSWDTAVALRDVGFEDMFSWVEHVVRWATARPDVQLDVRAHPAETRVRGFESADLAIDYVTQRFPELPPNIHLHGPESHVDSYALIQASTAVLVYTSTIGLEAALLGRPVLVAADVHYRGKGFTYDVEGPAHLDSLLADPSTLALTPEQYDLALAYAHVFFYESMIELHSLEERWRGKPTFPLETPADLDDDPAIQAICDLTLQEAKV